ncbi:MAG: diadenylate cyclase CdaA [Planctomycetota bacterium]
MFDQIVRYIIRVAGDPFTVLIQLVLIGLVVWWAMRFLEGTRGERLFKGAILLLVVVYVFIRLLPSGGGWDRLDFLYGRFLFFAFLGFVVVFQPELRRALMQLGQTRLFRGQSGRVERLVRELSNSAAYLSRNKIGALIALERQVGLGALVETGVPLDAQVTAELLNTIFYPGSTLHDMGVVIQENRITAAGVQFPLAESGATDRSLGSRHRAALGLSEESDAVVMVVSEETGRVSLAYDGQLSVGVPVDGLAEVLEALLLPRQAAPPPSPTTTPTPTVQDFTSREPAD